MEDHGLDALAAISGVGFQCQIFAALSSPPLPRELILGRSEAKSRSMETDKSAIAYEIIQKLTHKWLTFDQLWF